MGWGCGVRYPSARLKHHPGGFHFRPQNAKGQALRTHSGWCPCPVTASAPGPPAPRPARPPRSRLRVASGPPQTGQSCRPSCYQIKSEKKGGVLRCIGTPSISGSPLTAPSAGTAALCIISEREPASRSLRRSLVLSLKLDSEI